MSLALMSASSLLWAQNDTIPEIQSDGPCDGPCLEESFKEFMVDDCADEEIACDDSDYDEKVCEPQFFFIVEDMPVFPGGEVALRKYIAENLRYPENVEPRVSPTVYVRFVIDENGKVTNPELLRGVGEPFDTEALRVVSKQPLWKPGRQRGKPVKVSHSVPVKFVAE